MPSSTLAWLLSEDPRVELAVMFWNSAYDDDGLEKHKRRTKYGARLLVADLIGMYGGEMTIEDFKRRFRCSVCGARGSGITVEPVFHPPGFSAGGYAWPAQ